MPGRFRPLIAVPLLALVLAGCADDAELDTLQPQGPFSRAIDDLLNPVLIVAGIVFVLVLGASFYMAVKYRVRNDAEDEWPEQTHGNTRLEILWTLIPAVILAVIAVFSTATLFFLNDEQANAITVEVGGEPVSWEPEVVVVGQQWWWEYRYYFDGVDLEGVQTAQDLPPADIVTATQMVIPAGQEIELITTSRDVIHSHWIPALNGKRDAVPGRFQPWLIEADDPGVYFGQCTEFCGLSHSRMRMQVIALDEAGFQAWVDAQTAPYAPESEDAQAWLAQQRALTALAEGEELDEEPLPAPSATAVERGIVTFRQACSSCHLVDGVNDDIYTGATVVSGAAPVLTHFASRTTYAGGIFHLYEPDGSMDENTLEAWLRNPPAMKDMYAPTRGMPNLGLTEAQIDDLVAFLADTGTPPSDWAIAESEVE